QTGKRPVWSGVLCFDWNDDRSECHGGISLAYFMDYIAYHFRQVVQHHFRSLDIRSATQTIREGRDEYGADRGVRVYHRYAGNHTRSYKCFYLSGGGGCFGYNYVYHSLYDQVF